MGRRVSAVEREIQREMEARIEDAGFELVDVEWAGSSARPIIRVRIDVPGSAPGRGVTVNDCATVSRLLEARLDEHVDIPERYVLEVSSPGVERPLVRRRDWVRFAGQNVAVRGHDVLADRSTRLEGELLGVVGGAEGEEAEYEVRLRLENGDEVVVARKEIAGGNLLFEWE